MTQIARLTLKARFFELEARRWRLLAAIASKPADDITIRYAKQDIERTSTYAYGP